MSEAEEAKRINELRKEVTEQQSKISKKIELILKSPISHDPVYDALERLFKVASKYNLNKGHESHAKIHDLALKRFMLGYPPRKKNDTSIGDAINWEWIVECAVHSEKSIIIVTRDTDYGANLKSESFINDWLQEEFKERALPGSEIFLTTRLSEAFKTINVSVSEDMVEEESRILEEHRDFGPSDNTDSVTNKIFDILKEYE